MGSYDGAEICDIVGLFLLSKLKKLKLNADIGCYKDDGLGVSSSTPRQVESIKKKICETFRKFGLKITIEANKKIVQYLDVELNLEKGSFRPYIKPGDTPLYVHMKSNHPPSVTKNIPASINRRLSNLSSDEEMFNSVAPIFQKALENAGYKVKLQYKPQQSNNSKTNRSRKRKIIWWNPPYSSSVKTKVGQQFFKLLEKHFPKEHSLRKILNKNTVKMSYRTTPNVSKIIEAYNARFLNQKKEDPPCNCRLIQMAPWMVSA